jgi:hypothetical protein
MSTPDEPDQYNPQTPEEAQAAFEHLFDEVIDLLQMTVDNIEKNTGSVPEGLEKKISQLENDFAQFHEIGNSLIPDEQGNTKLSRQERSSIERSKKVIEAAEQAKLKLPKRPPEGPTDISDDKERKKHFKRLGRKKI